MINTAATVNNPAHKNGEEETALRKTSALDRSATGGTSWAKVPFLKKKCIAVSSISLAKSSNNIFRVTFFLNMDLFSDVFIKIIRFQQYCQQFKQQVKENVLMP